MERPKVIKDENWRYLDPLHPVNDYIKELHKYIDYLLEKTPPEDNNYNCIECGSTEYKATHLCCTKCNYTFEI